MLLPEKNIHWKCFLSNGAFVMLMIKINLNGITITVYVLFVYLLPCLVWYIVVHPNSTQPFGN